MRLAVARIGRPHGIKGEATVEVLTDRPDERFHDGALLESDNPSFPTLEIAGSRLHQGIWLLRFKGIDDRTAVERLRGVRLYADIVIDEEQDDGSYHFEQLTGMLVKRSDGRSIGQVINVLDLPGQDLLEVATEDGPKLIPLVSEFIKEVDLVQNVILVDVPEGLVD